MNTLTVLLLVALWVVWSAVTFWVILDSVYGDHRLPGVAVGGPWGLLAMMGWVFALAAVVVVVSTWLTV